jgi:glutamate--cysteine ligase
LGTESEKFGVLRSTRAPLPYDGEVSVMRVFQELCKRGWHAVRETPDGEIIALTKDGASITLEPGAQFELSGAPLPTVHDVHAENVAHLSELAPISELLGIDWLAAGYHPLATQAELSWVPKQRYAIMREYFPKVGSRGLDMMRRTATVQVNFDYRDEEDAMRKLRVALRLSPFAMAIFANSPFAEGRVTGNKSERGLVWLDVDGDRGGLLPALLDEGKRFDDYIEWALDAPMYMFKREGAVVANTGQTFRSFWKDGYQGHRPHQDDWTTHLNTMFPETRCHAICCALCRPSGRGCSTTKPASRPPSGCSGSTTSWHCSDCAKTQRAGGWTRRLAAVRCVRSRWSCSSWPAPACLAATAETTVATTRPDTSTSSGRWWKRASVRPTAWWLRLKPARRAPPWSASSKPVPSRR